MRLRSDADAQGYKADHERNLTYPALPTPRSSVASQPPVLVVQYWRGHR
jgi:hypothetical protein